MGMMSRGLGVGLVALTLTGVGVGQETPALDMDLVRTKQTDDRVDIELKGVALDAVVGGKGRFLFVHVANRRHVVCIDLCQAKIVSEFPIKSDEILIAAGATKFVIVDVRSNRIDVFDIATSRLVQTSKFGLRSPMGVALGSESEGPLVIAAKRAWSDDNATPRFQFLDLKTLEPIASFPREIVGKADMEPLHLRASPSGSTFTAWNRFKNDLDMFEMTKNGPIQKELKRSKGNLVPADDAIRFYSGWNISPTKAGSFLLAGYSSDLQLSIHTQMSGSYKILSTSITPSFGRHFSVNTKVRIPAAALDNELTSRLTVDKRIVFVPPADVLAVIAENRIKVVVHRVDVAGLLTAANASPILVVSRPPARVVAGEAIEYPIRARSRERLAFELETSLNGLTVDRDGVVRWRPNAGQVGVHLISMKISSDASPPLLHYFRIRVDSDSTEAPKVVAAVNPPSQPTASPAPAPTPTPTPTPTIGKVPEATIGKSPETTPEATSRTTTSIPPTSGAPAGLVFTPRPPRTIKVAKESEFARKSTPIRSDGLTASAAETARKLTLDTALKPGTDDLPAAIGPKDVGRVKRATVRLTVSFGKDELAEGSGFFAMAKGLVVTNAHVVGGPGSGSPKSVKVAIFSGQDDEFERDGEILAIDRESDLALVAVSGSHDLLPPPLTLSGGEVAELQKVYAFGFPLGVRLGRDLTVSESSISSLRKVDGRLSQLQLNGGITRGNSGGPIVDTQGDVVGVAVAIIAGTQINFAIPVERILDLAEPRFGKPEFGPMLADDGSLSLSVRLAMIDRFGVGVGAKGRLDAWIGAPGRSRPPSLAAPKARAGDEPVQSIATPLTQGAFDSVVAMPMSIPEGKALWVRPVIELASTTARYGEARCFLPKDLTSPKSARLVLDPTKTSQRTLTLSAKLHVVAEGPNDAINFRESLESTGLEVVHPAGDGDADVVVRIGKLDFDAEFAGTKVEMKSLAANQIRDHVFAFAQTPEGDLRRRRIPVFRDQGDLAREGDLLTRFWLNAFESSNIVLPSESVSPGDSWRSDSALYLLSGKRTEVVEAALVNTYLGIRTIDGRKHAVIRFEGPLAARGTSTAKGTLSGSALVDLEQHFVAHVEIAGHTQLTMDGITGRITFQASVDRSAGNTLSLERPSFFAKAIFPPALATIPTSRPVNLLDRQETLTLTDPIDPHFAFKVPHHDFYVRVLPGKLYLFDVVGVRESAMDPRLRLETQDGRILSQDADSGGDGNARIIHKASKEEILRVVVSAEKPATVGPYQLAVHEIAEMVPLRPSPKRDFVPQEELPPFRIIVRQPPVMIPTPRPTQPLPGQPWIPGQPPIAGLPGQPPYGPPTYGPPTYGPPRPGVPIPGMPIPGLPPTVRPGFPPQPYVPQPGFPGRKF